jgi:hypothetical protein
VTVSKVFVEAFCERRRNLVQVQAAGQDDGQQNTTQQRASCRNPSELFVGSEGKRTDGEFIDTSRFWFKLCT